MARNQFDFNSASSQFFICLKNSCSDDLDGQYAAFGKSPRVWILSISFVQILRKATVSRRISSR